MVDLFVRGGIFMWPILGAFVIGLGIVFERFYSLIMSSVNTKKFFGSVENTLENDGIDATVELCDKTRGPVAEIFHAGLTRYDRGLDEVEKAIQNAGGIEMSFLERNMIWLNAVITIAPLLGFTGTVWGMINAFDKIKEANDISPAIVAGGISQALLTTAFGLVVAMVIQICQNFFVSRIDHLILDMEEHSVQLLDTLYTMSEESKKG